MTGAQKLIALLSGILFALGLGLSGMTDARKVVAFLDVTGHWDPSLAFVMLGAIAVHVGFAQRAKRGGKPLLAPRFVLPDAALVDGKLLLGSALFGVGWGTAGYCPGPVLVSLVTCRREALIFTAAMVTGMLSVELVRRARTPQTRPA